MCTGKRRTLRVTIVTIFSYMTRDVSVFVKRDTIFRLFFFWKLPQFYTFNSKFRKVVRQHNEVMVESTTWVLLEIYLAFQQWKNFENPLRIDEVIAMSLVYYFLGTQTTVIPIALVFPEFLLDFRATAVRRWLSLNFCSKKINILSPQNF